MHYDYASAPAGTFRAADRLQVESQLFYTQSADLIVLNICWAVQTHRMNIWNLAETQTHVELSCCDSVTLSRLNRNKALPAASPALRPAAAGRSWPAAGRCRCWWASDRRGRPCGAACAGTSGTRCGSSPGWWAGGRYSRTHCSRWDRTGSLSTGPPALASCQPAAEEGDAELRRNAWHKLQQLHTNWNSEGQNVTARLRLGNT